MDTNKDAIERRWRKVRGDRLAMASFVLALLASAVLLFAPFGLSSESVGSRAIRASGSSATLPPPSTLPAPRTTIRMTNESLFSTDGWRIVPAFATPVVLAGIVLLLRRTRFRRAAKVTGMVVLFVFVVLGSLSIGIFYVPAAVLMAIAASRTPGRSKRVEVFA